MQELVDKLKAEAGLTDEQAKKAIATIKSFVVEKFPMYLEESNGLTDDGAFPTTRTIGSLVRGHYAGTGFKEDRCNNKYD